MIAMHILRMLADVSFFFAFAGFVTDFYGGRSPFPILFLQCLCFGLSSLGKDSRLLRLLFLLPMVIGCFLYPNSLADCILMLPTGGYILWLVYEGEYALEPGRQQQLFKIFSRAVAIFLPIAMLTGGMAQLTAVTVPCTLIMMTSSILLMRSLRHTPKVYRQIKYQLTNLSLAGIILAIAFFLSSDRFLSFCFSSLQLLYNRVLLPVFTFLFWLFLLPVQLIARLFSFIEIDLSSGKEIPGLDMSGAAAVLKDLSPPAQPLEWLRIAALSVVVLAGVFLLFLFFRWMKQKSFGAGEVHPFEEQRSSAFSSKAPLPVKNSSFVRSVRAQYRKFLKLCVSLGMERKVCDTSLDVDRQANRRDELRGISTAVREIYIQARYAGRADKNSVEKMKKLYAEGKHATKHSG